MWAMVAGAAVLAPAPAFAQNGQPPARAPGTVGQPLGQVERSEEVEQPAEPGPADLMPTLPLASAAGWILRPEPAPAGREEVAEENLERYFDDQLNEDRLAHLGADPWYHDMMRAMRRQFDPNMREVERQRRAPMNVAGRVIDEMGRYASGPEPPQDARGAPPPEVANGHLMADEQAMLEYMDQVSLLNAPVTWYRVDVRVTHNPEGVVSAAWVIDSSGYPSLDEEALRAVRAGAASAPPPPGQVTEGRDAIQSDWAFEAGDVATYMNQVGCVEDPVRGGMQCAAGGRGIVRTRLRLLRVHDATRESFEERRARVRHRPPRLHP